MKPLAHLHDETIELTYSDSVDITERGISSDYLPSTSKRQKTHPLQELLGSKFQSYSSSQHTTTTVSNEDVILFKLTRYNTEKPALLSDNPLTWWKEKHDPFLTYLY